MKTSGRTAERSFIGVLLREYTYVTIKRLPESDYINKKSLFKIDVFSYWLIIY